MSSDVRLQLGGSFSEDQLKEEVIKNLGWKRVDELGFLNRDEVKNVLNKSIAGLVTLHPTVNYIESLPVKMFEYMSAGTPVIASDFPIWREIVAGNNCGVCVNPLDPKEIASAIDYLIDNPEVAEKMGRNGKAAIERKYNWGVEEKKLIDFYNQILKHG